MIAKLFTLAGNGETGLCVLAILLLLGLIVGLAAALTIYYADRRQDRKRRCVWCHPIPEDMSSSICHKHARLIRRQRARQRVARKRLARAETKRLPVAA